MGISPTKQFNSIAQKQILNTWQMTKLGNCLDELYRYPTYYGIKYVSNGVPEVRGELLKVDGTIEEKAELYRYVSRETANRFPRVQLEPQDFVMSVRGTMGKVAIVPEILSGAIITANLIRMKFLPSAIYPKWARHFLQSDFFQEALDLATSATTIKTIQIPQLCNIIFPKPPINEQRHIAEILDTLNEAIEKTEALIAKLKAMKQGVLHDLMTRGLDENSKLRDPEAHHEQFKDSPLGRIPHIWNIMVFRDVLAGIIDFRGKTPLKIGMKWGDDDIPALSANNVEMGRINLKKETYYGAKELYQRWMTAGDPAKGDVLMTLEAPLGNVAQIPDDRPYILSQRVVLFKTKDELMCNTFFRYQLTYEPFQCALLSESTGTTAKGIQRAKLEKLLVLVPPRYNEQELIVSKLEAIDTRIRTEEQYRDKLKLQKKGLMHDLLTGKVRVNTKEVDA